VPKSVENSANQTTLSPSAKKLQIAAAMFDFAYRVKRFQLAKNHPEWPEAKIHAETLASIDRGSH